MIIHCFNIFNICRDICNDEGLSKRNAIYFFAGILEMLVFDFVIYNLMR